LGIHHLIFPTETVAVRPATRRSSASNSYRAQRPILPVLALPQLLRTPVKI
jgi:hypothetical protein